MSDTYVPKRYLSCADTAKLLRAHLKREFPATKFSVRSHTYAGGASIHVDWVDGPRSSSVQAVADLYAGASFDGMIDLKSYHTTWLRDESGEPQEVHMGADFVPCQRRISDEWRAEIVQLVGEAIGVELPADERGVNGFGRVPAFVYEGRITKLSNGDEYLSTVIHQYTAQHDRV